MVRLARGAGPYTIQLQFTSWDQGGFFRRVHDRVVVQQADTSSGPQLRPLMVYRVPPLGSAGEGTESIPSDPRP